MHLAGCRLRHTKNETFWYSLQEENETFRNFLIRTDILARKLGVNVQDLPEIIGIGRASLFCCRTGTRPITGKSWLKLEAAEQAAGIGQAAAVVREEAPVYDDAQQEILQRLARVESLLEILVAKMNVDSPPPNG